VGALAAQNKAGQHPFGGDDLLALSLLAAAASVTLGYHQLHEDARRRGRELSTLYEAVRRVSGPLSTQEVLNAVLEQAAAHIENRVVAVFLLNDERTHFYVAADSGLNDDQREVTLPTDAGLGAALLHGTRPHFLGFAPDDVDEADEAEGGNGEEHSRPNVMTRGAEGAGILDGGPPPHEPPFPGLAVRSGLAAPIRSGETTHGLVLAVSGQPPGAYRLADANLLSALAAQAAAAMENAWLYEDAQRRAEEAAALYELSQAITATRRLDVILDLVADSTRQLLGVDKFALFLRDPAAPPPSSPGRGSGGAPAAAASAPMTASGVPAVPLRLVVERGLPSGAGERLRPLVGQGIPGWVVEFETPTAVRDVAADHRNRSAPLHDEGVVSLCAMPLQVGASTIGVLCALSSRRRLFTVAEVELLYTIANQAAIAIENARVYADVRQKAQELRRYFHRVGRALGSQGSPGEVPQLIASLTLEVMGADRCALYALQEELEQSAPGAAERRPPPGRGGRHQLPPRFSRTARQSRKRRPRGAAARRHPGRLRGAPGAAPDRGRFGCGRPLRELACPAAHWRCRVGRHGPRQRRRRPNRLVSGGAAQGRQACDRRA
jgi:GAF domain-containing protein